MEASQLISSIREIFGTKEFIPLHEPAFTNADEQNVQNCIKSTFVSSVGQYVNLVEEKLAQITSTAKATAVVNGTAALQVALRLAGVRPKDEVITQALTFVATTNSIVYNGATPIFLDVDLDTMGLSPIALEEWLSENAELRDNGTYNINTGKRISACMPMHTFGFICRINEIVEICDRWRIPVVEDAAESLGSYLGEKGAGSFGLMGALSFNGNKIVTSGGGGAIVSSDNSWADKAKYLTTTAKITHPYEYVHDQVGYNFRMPNLNAALLLAQLERISKIIASKELLFTMYNDAIGNSIKLIKPPQEQNWNYWLMSILCENKKERDSILNSTNESGVMTRPIWRLMFKLPMYTNCQKDHQRNAEYLEDRVVNIPSSARF